LGLGDLSFRTSQSIRSFFSQQFHSFFAILKQWNMAARALVTLIQQKHIEFAGRQHHLADRNTVAVMLTTIFRLVSSRLQFVTLFLLIIAVIDLGHVQSTTPRPSGFTRIARDLGRQFCNGECEGLARPWTLGSAP
jgi:hypothetical protein